MQDWRREREREREGKKKRIRKKEKKNQNCSQLSLGLLPPLPCCYSLGSFLLTANSQISGKKNNNNGNCDNPSNWKAAFKLFFVLFRGYPSCCTMPHTTMVHTYSTLLCCTVQNVHPKKKKKKWSHSELPPGAVGTAEYPDLKWASGPRKPASQLELWHCPSHGLRPPPRGFGGRTSRCSSPNLHWGTKGAKTPRVGSEES